MYNNDDDNTMQRPATSVPMFPVGYREAFAVHSEPIVHERELQSLVWPLPHDHDDHNGDDMQRSKFRMFYLGFSEPMFR